MTIHNLTFNQTDFDADKSIKTSALTKQDHTANLNRTLQQIAKNAVAQTCRTPTEVDPMLGSFSFSSSLASKLVRQHGIVLTKALGAVLEHHGLRVFAEQKVPIAASAWAIAESNAITALKAFNPPKRDSYLKDYRADLFVFDPVTGHGVLLDGKRGCGSADTSSKDALNQKLCAAFCTVADWARRELGVNVLSRDARVVDFYGRTGYADSIKIGGCDLDAYFGLYIERPMAMFNKAFFDYSQILLSSITENGAGSFTKDRQRAPITNGFSEEDFETHRFPKPTSSRGADMFDDMDPFQSSGADRINSFEDSRVAALRRFQAVQLRAA